MPQAARDLNLPCMPRNLEGGVQNDLSDLECSHMGILNNI
jgi:hypothetical protein